MKKNCLNCNLYMRCKGITELGKVYACNPVGMLGIKKEDLEDYCCDFWEKEFPSIIGQLFGR